MKTMSARRPACLIASLGAMTPSVGFAETGAPAGDHRIGGAPPMLQGLSPSATLIAIAALFLLGVAALVFTGRMNWRLGAIAIVGGCALFGGDAMLDGAWTAIAVSP